MVVAGQLTGDFWCDDAKDTKAGFPLTRVVTPSVKAGVHTRHCQNDVP